MQSLRGVVRLPGAGLIHVADNEYVAITERSDIDTLPRSACDRGGAMAKRRDSVGILFAFGVKHAGIGIRQQFGQAIEHALHAFEIIDPAAIAIWATLTKVLWIVTRYLIKQRAVLVCVRICLDDRS